MTYSQVRDLFRNNQVSSFVLEGDSLILTLKEPYGGRYNVVHQLYSFSVFYEDLHELIDEQWGEGVLKEYDYTTGWEAPWWLAFIPYLIILVVFGVLWFVMMNRGGAGGDKTAMRFGRARTRVGTGDKKVTFADVAGEDEEKGPAPQKEEQDDPQDDQDDGGAQDSGDNRAEAWFLLVYFGLHPRLSTSPIFATRRAWRPPSKGVSRKVSMIFSARPGPTTRAPMARMLASLCRRVSSAE